MTARPGPALVLVPLLLFGGAPPGVASPSRPPASRRAAVDSEAVIVELRIGRLAGATVQAYRVRTEVLVPLTRFLQLAEARFQLSADGRLEAQLYPREGALLIDAASDIMTLGAHRVRIEPDFKLFRDRELYVGSERLGDLLGQRFLVDWVELTVTLLEPGELPLARRLRRDAEREALLRRAQRPRPELELGLERPRWDGLVFDYSVLTPTDAPVDGSTYALALGADALGGSLELGLASVGAVGTGDARLEASWNGVWRDRAWVKQVRVGDGFTSGPRVRDIRGALVTNAPFVRPSLVGAARFVGALEAGWAVDAYVGGALIAYDSADAEGRFGFDVPVRYGENPVDFVAYGPFGEVREFNRTYRVLAELLPARRFEYGASAGACDRSPCDATANLDLRYGLSRRLTLRAGADAFWRDGLPDLGHPYAAVVANPTTSWTVEAEGVNRALARGALGFEPSLNLRLCAEYVHYARSTVAPLVTASGRLSDLSVGAFLRPIAGQGLVFLDAGVQRTRTLTGTGIRGQLGASVQARDVRFLPFARLERTAPLAGSASTAAYVGMNTFALPRRRLGAALGPIWLRTTTEVETTRGARLASWSAAAARPFGALHRIEIGAGWQRGATAPTYVLTVTSQLPVLRSTTTVTAPPGAAAAAVEFLQGSVLWDRRSGRLAGAPGPSLERSGLSGRVFLDENGNGVREAGEPGVGGVRVMIGTRTAVSDSGGRYQVWDIVPFEPILVSIDSLSLASPLLVPLFATTSVVPGPNRFRALDVPIVPAGVIEGRVLRDGRGVGAVTLRLTDRGRGTRRSLTTFSDGAFYLLGVKPGDYELTVEGRVLEALGVAAAPVRFSLVPTPQDVGRSGIDVLLVPRR